jgi:hypothetical protein
MFITVAQESGFYPEIEQSCKQSVRQRSIVDDKTVTEDTGQKIREILGRGGKFSG